MRWIVHYEISGQPLTDYWFHIGRQWVSDLLRLLLQCNHGYVWVRSRSLAAARNRAVKRPGRARWPTASDERIRASEMGYQGERQR